MCLGIDAPFPLFGEFLGGAHGIEGCVEVIDDSNGMVLVSNDFGDVRVGSDFGGGADPSGIGRTDVDGEATIASMREKRKTSDTDPVHGVISGQ